MNINVYLENNVAKTLNKISKNTDQTRNAIIREAIKEWIIKHQQKQWPKSILEFNGFPDFIEFESYRTDLIDSDEDPFK